jgi:4-hydroxy-tetrahydrodipicolinate reductase
MKIALLGYGKMGKTIEKMALQRGHEVVYKSSSSSQSGNFKEAQIAIEFSIPEIAVANIKKCFDAEIPIVSGTTGWLDQKKEVEKACQNCNGSFIYASNFSIGVHLFFNLNRHLAKLMEPWKEYDLSIEETHHTEKKDAPSGTAISLAEDLLPFSDKKNWIVNDVAQDAISIKALRESDVKGTHSVAFTSKIDTISIKHVAHTRDGFAKGAITAAEYLIDKKGIFTMKDVLGL